MGFRSQRSTRVPLLTARHKALCLAWSFQHRHWTVEDYKHFAWSDESRFQLNRAGGRERVWRQPHESMDPSCQQGTVQAGGGSVMNCYRVAPGELNSSEFRHFRWPPKSPDMNLLNIYGMPCNMLFRRDLSSPLTPTNLWTALQDS
ncbi:transposable element Tcb2 transposase [Trichonephila clavipes]|nr:transposable element Tcb2 transposase [Trichonephila clavipes]